MSPGTPRSDGDLWKIIQNYKVAAAAVVLLSLGLLGHLAPLAQLIPDPSTVIGGILKSISDALITTALVGLVWEWWVRNEGALSMRTEVVRANLVERDILRRFDRHFLLNAVKSCLDHICHGDPKISESIYSVVSKHADSSKNVRRNYNYDGQLRKPAGRVAILTTKCYSYTATISYETILLSDHLTIGYSNTRDGLDAIPDDNLIIRWRCHKIPGLLLGSEDLFSILQNKIDDYDVLLEKSVHEKYVLYKMRFPGMRSKKGSWVRLSFTIQSAVRDDEHYISNSVGFPTENFRMKIDWTDALGVIPTVKAIEHFCSDQDSIVSWTPPDSDDPHTVAVTVNGWILPSSGVVFVW